MYQTISKAAKIRIAYKVLLSIFLYCSGINISAAQNTRGDLPGKLKAQILNVPATYPTISAAVKQAKDGDQIIIAPGVYKENSIIINKAITVSSAWKLNQRQDDIDKTIIDAEGKTLFTLNKVGAEISGLTLINGDHTLENNANVSIVHNHFMNNLDGISMEGGSGGYLAYNLIENDRDDGIDMDIGDDAKTAIGSDIVVAYNTIINSHDDGIEIRLFTRPNQNINYNIGHNQIIGSRNAGIQLISYDVPTGKIFNIHHNSFQHCKIALGCMSGGRTVEDMEGTGKMDEKVYFYNNTIAYNQMAATGGTHMTAINNVVYQNTLGGFKHFGKQSALINNLFYDNNGADLIEVDTNAMILPTVASFGTKTSLTDLEAIMGESKLLSPKADYSSAGNDLVVSKAELTVTGKIGGKSGAEINPEWKQVSGPGAVTFSDQHAVTSLVKLPIQGIYEFLFSPLAQTPSKDKLTIRYISKAKKQEYFFKENKENTFQADRYQYAYGNIREIIAKDNPSQTSVLMEKGSSLEYSLGIAQNKAYIMWIKAKNKIVKGQLDITYDNKKMGIITISDAAAFSWYKLPETLKASAGQWSLLIQNLSGTIEVKDFLFTFDPKFNPAK